VIRADAPAPLRHLLAGSRPDTPVWRGSPASRLLEEQKYAVVAGTSTETWLAERGSTLGIKAQVKPVPDYRTALQLLVDGKVDVFFGERSVVLGAMNDTMRDKLAVVQRMFTRDLAGLALTRGDDDFRLVVDTSLSTLYGSKEFATEYAKWFGPLDEDTSTFFMWNRLGQ
jgi:polar amino acid transport system substrate-binding protein